MENSEVIRDRSNYKKIREEKYKIDSKERLSKIIKKKIETTMIGALSSVEAHFGFLWGQEHSEPLSEQEEMMKEIFQKIRSEVLDKGNNQIRNMDAEFSQYDIEWKKYSLVLPVKQGNKE
jgi:hypothetical protein